MDIPGLLCYGDGFYVPPQYYNNDETGGSYFNSIPVTASPHQLTSPVTKQPPLISGLDLFAWPDIQLDPSDESSEEEEIQIIPRYDDTELIRSPKRRRLNTGISADVYNFNLPHDEMRMWDFYEKMTVKILSCKNATGENPWRDDLISRAAHSEPLKHALFAMTRFHMKRHIPGEAWQMATMGLNHTNASFQALHKAMNNGLAFEENNIAAMLVLSFSQVLNPLNTFSKSRYGMIRD
jgi:hypothetical protein